MYPPDMPYDDEPGDDLLAAAVKPPEEPWKHPHARIVEWTDGDTASVEIDFGFGCKLADVFRLKGINAPEKRSTDPRERAAGRASLAFARSLMPDGSPVVLYTFKDKAFKDKREKYRRYLAKLSSPTCPDFAAAAVAAGHARVYDGGKREPWFPPEGKA